MRRSRRRALPCAALMATAAPFASACDGAFDPAGPRASPIADLWWFMLVVATAVCILVTVLALGAVVAGRRRGRALDEPGRGLWGMVIGGGVLLPFVVVVVLIVWSMVIDRQVLAEPDDALHIQVTGHQFWWEVRYPDEGITTANEIHIPAGRPVSIELTSNDVIHSFWVPRLGGKADLIPGRTNRFYIEATEPGEYRGQCAEYCGIQHARMFLLVIAQHEDDFAAWVAAQQEPAAEPFEDELFERGRQVFLGRGCAACHAIEGHEAAGQVGPNLTHLASRQTIAAGVLPNNRGNLGGWVLDPHSVKPGVRMPANRLSPEELDALLHYLTQLE